MVNREKGAVTVLAVAPATPPQNNCLMAALDADVFFAGASCCCGSSRLILLVVLASAALIVQSVWAGRFACCSRMMNLEKSSDINSTEQQTVEEMFVRYSAVRNVVTGCLLRKAFFEKSSAWS